MQHKRESCKKFRGLGIPYFWDRADEVDKSRVRLLEDFRYMAKMLSIRRKTI